jgi:acid phosphatase (class A)
MRRLTLVAILLSLGACATSPPPAGPTPSSPPATAAPGPSYIAAARLDAVQFLGPPPAPASPAQAADMAAVRDAQALHGQPRWVLAQHDDDVSPFTAFGPVLGPAFSKANAPRTAALFDILFADARSLTAPSKEAFGRPRPPLVDPGLKTCMPLEPTKSYPSGHATRGWLMALILAEVFPEKANALLARGRDYGDSRVVCAEHFPTDVHAGRLIGAAVFAAAKDNPDFQRDFEGVRAELRALPR